MLAGQETRQGRVTGDHSSALEDAYEDSETLSTDKDSQEVGCDRTHLQLKSSATHTVNQLKPLPSH